MTQEVDKQSYARQPVPFRVPTADNTNLPPLMTKKELALRMQCLMACGSVNVKRFYSHVLTEEVLAKLGLTMKQVRTRSFKTFSRTQTVILIEVLNL